MLAAFHQLYLTYNTTQRARGVDRLEHEILLPDPVNTNLHLFPSVTNAYVNVLCARKAFALISSTAADVHLQLGVRTATSRFTAQILCNHAGQMPWAMSAFRQLIGMGQKRNW